MPTLEIDHLFGVSDDADIEMVITGAITSRYPSAGRCEVRAAVRKALADHVSPFEAGAASMCDFHQKCDQRGSSRNVVGRTSARTIDCA